MTYPRKSIESGLAYAAEKRLTLPHPIRMHEIEHDFQPQNVSISTNSLGRPAIQTELSDIARLLGLLQSFFSWPGTPRALQLSRFALGGALDRQPPRRLFSTLTAPIADFLVWSLLWPISGVR
jgi:hypothetical protein